MEIKIKIIIDGIDNGTKEFIHKSCRENIVQVGGCLKDLGRPPLIVQDCVIDALTIPEVDQRTKYIQAMVGKFATSCNISIPFIETKCCMKSLSKFFYLVWYFHFGSLLSLFAHLCETFRRPLPFVFASFRQLRLHHGLERGYPAYRTVSSKSIPIRRFSRRRGDGSE